MLGFINQSEMLQVYAAADCLALPSDTRETWGLVVNEALARQLAPFRASSASEPELDHASVFPTWSVNVMIVLLNDACTCTNPTGTFFFSFFLKDFFLPEPFAGAFAGAFAI